MAHRGDWSACKDAGKETADHHSEQGVNQAQGVTRGRGGAMHLGAGRVSKAESNSGGCGETTPHCCEDQFFSAKQHTDAAVNRVGGPSTKTRQTVQELLQRDSAGLTESQRAKLKLLLMRNVDLFAAMGEVCTRAPLVQHHIDNGGAAPVRFPHHQLLLAKRRRPSKKLRRRWWQQG